MSYSFKKSLFYLAFTFLISFLAGKLLLKIVDLAFLWSDQPIKSLMIKGFILFLFMLPFILKKKELYIYYFVLSFPFFPLIGRRISLVNIYGFILFVVYWKEILLLIRNKNNLYKFPFLFLLISFFYTTILSQFPSQAFEKMVFYLSYVGIFLALTAYLNSILKIKVFCCLVLTVYFFCCFVSLWQVVFGIESIKFNFGDYNNNVDIYGYAKRIPSIFCEAQRAGQYFACMGILSMGIFSKIFYKNKLGIFSLFLGGIFLLFTISRLAILSYILGVFIVLLFPLSLKRTILLVTNAFLILILLIGTYQSIAPQGVKERFSPHNQVQSFEIRNNGWVNSFPIFIQNPLGVGLGGYNRFAAGVDTGHRFSPEAKRNAKYTGFESSYLSLLYSLGFIGFGAFIWLVCIYFKLGLQLLSQNRMYTFSIYLICAMIVWLIPSAISLQMEEFQPMIVFTLLFSLMTAYHNLYFKKQMK